MALNTPYSAYQSTQTTTASQAQLIIMLHDGAIRFLAQAANATLKKDYSAKATYFGKAAAIVEHLWGTLDKQRGGEVAENLDRLYAYMHERLTWANLNDDVAPVKEVMQHLRALRESWAELDARSKAERAPAVESRADGEELLIAA